MKKNWIIYDNVKINELNFIPGNFVVIGEQNGGTAGNLSPTIIGKKPIIRSHTIIYSGNIIGDFFQTGHGVLIRENNVIGDNVSIGSHSDIEHDVKIGNNVRIHSNVFIPEFTFLEDDCWIGPGVILTNSKYPRSENSKKELHGPIIGSGSIIGAGVIILPGINIGKNVLIGAGSVVTRNVPDEVVVMGNPAKISKSIHDLSMYSK